LFPFLLFYHFLLLITEQPIFDKVENYYTYERNSNASFIIDEFEGDEDDYDEDIVDEDGFDEDFEFGEDSFIPVLFPTSYTQYLLDISSINNKAENDKLLSLKSSMHVLEYLWFTGNKELPTPLRYMSWGFKLRHYLYFIGYFVGGQQFRARAFSDFYGLHSLPQYIQGMMEHLDEFDEDWTEIVYSIDMGETVSGLILEEGDSTGYVEDTYSDGQVYEGARR